MYRSFTIHNFRCFEELSLSGLERVNLIAGVNNVGKTALLEALFLHCGAYNPALTLRLSAFRGIDWAKFEMGKGGETPWDSLFRGFNTSKKLELAGENSVIGRRVIRMRLVRDPEDLAAIAQSAIHLPDKSEGVPLSLSVPEILELEYEEPHGRQGKSYVVFDQQGLRTEPIIVPAPPFPAFFLAARMRIPQAEDAERFGKLELVGRQDLLVEALKVIEARLRRIAVVVAGGVPTLHGDVGLSRLVPLPVMGEGLARLTSVVLAISSAQNGVVLVDEIENGLHHSALPKVWQAIDTASRRFNTQVFATTHSRECIAAAHAAFEGSESYSFRLYRLEHTGPGIRAVAYDRDTLEAALQTDLEVR